MAWGCVFVFGKDALISNDGTHTLTAEAVEVVPPASVARVEVEVVGAVLFLEIILALRHAAGQTQLALNGRAKRVGVELAFGVEFGPGRKMLLPLILLVNFLPFTPLSVVHSLVQLSSNSLISSLVGIHQLPPHFTWATSYFVPLISEPRFTYSPFL